MSWQNYVEAAQGLGFTKCTLIARANYQAVALSAQGDIASAWKDGDKDVNENQELLDDWSDVKKRTFCFYQKKFNIILREGDKEKQTIVCAQGNDICLARQFATIWFIAYGQKKGMAMKKAAKGDAKEAAAAAPAGFAGAQQAYNKICKDVWDALDEAGI